MKRKTLCYVATALFIVAAAIQFIKPELTNPPVEPKMSFAASADFSPETVRILSRSCTDCHSHSTNWTWYSHVAPVSWLMADDVKEGRQHLNLSEWGSLSKEESHVKLKEICSEVQDGEMPLWIYTLMHKEARLSPSDKDTLCNIKK
jgi:Haem-binding domain